MSVIKKEIKRKFLYLSAYFYKVSEFLFFWRRRGGGWGGSINLPREPPFLKNKPHYTYKSNAQRDKMLNRCKLKVSKEKLTRLPTLTLYVKYSLSRSHFWALRVIYCLYFFTLEQSPIFCLWLSPSLLASCHLAARLHTTTP